MTGIRKNIWQRLKQSFVFRSAYKAEHAKAGVAYQIKAMREDRGWLQSDLAAKANKSQSNIARLEDSDYGKFSVQTLLEIADAFDVWLSIEFVPFSIGLQRTENRTSAALNAISFDSDWESREQSIAASAVSIISIQEWRGGYKSPTSTNTSSPQVSTTVPQVSTAVA